MECMCFSALSGVNIAHTALFPCCVSNVFCFAAHGHHCHVHCICYPLPMHYGLGLRTHFHRRLVLQTFFDVRGQKMRLATKWYQREFYGGIEIGVSSVVPAQGPPGPLEDCNAGPPSKNDSVWGISDPKRVSFSTISTKRLLLQLSTQKGLKYRYLKKKARWGVFVFQHLGCPPPQKKTRFFWLPAAHMSI